MAKIIPQSTCSATDLECLCTNQALNVEIAGCALGACTLYEGLETKNVSMTMCGAPVRDKSVQPIAIALVFGIMALIAFILRVCAVLANSGRSVGLDDCMISLAVALAVLPTVFAFTCEFDSAIILRTLTNVRAVVQNGLGKDMWTLTLSQIKNLLRVSQDPVQCLDHRPNNVSSTTTLESCSISGPSQPRKLLSCCSSFACSQTRQFDDWYMQPAACARHGESPFCLPLPSNARRSRTPGSKLTRVGAREPATTSISRGG